MIEKRYVSKVEAKQIPYKVSSNAVSSRAPSLRPFTHSPMIDLTCITCHRQVEADGARCRTESCGPNMSVK